MTNRTDQLASILALTGAQDALIDVNCRRGRVQQLALAATAEALGERPKGRGADKAAREAWILRYEEEKSERGEGDLFTEWLSARETLLAAYRVWMVEMNGGKVTAKILTESEWSELLQGPRRAEIVSMAAEVGRK